MNITTEVKARIEKIYQERQVKLYALALSYAGQAINLARAEKGWTNQTSDAVNRMFSKAFIDNREIGFFLSHGVFYGIYLELANNRLYEIIRPIIKRLAPQFLEDARRII